jgi:hypothetical protein
MVVASCLEQRMHPVCRWELDAGVDSKTPAAGFEPAVRRLEHVDQFHTGSLDHRLIAEPIVTIHQPIHESVGFCVCLLYTGNLVQ